MVVIIYHVAELSILHLCLVYIMCCRSEFNWVSVSGIRIQKGKNIVPENRNIFIVHKADVPVAGILWSLDVLLEV
jgi:hypothetical protein